MRSGEVGRILDRLLAQVGLGEDKRHRHRELPPTLAMQRFQVGDQLHREHLLRLPLGNHADRVDQDDQPSAAFDQGPDGRMGARAFQLARDRLTRDVRGDQVEAVPLAGRHLAVDPVPAVSLDRRLCREPLTLKRKHHLALQGQRERPPGHPVERAEPVREHVQQHAEVDRLPHAARPEDADDPGHVGTDED